jgi:hypothetical protein
MPEERKSESIVIDYTIAAARPPRRWLSRYFYGTAILTPRQQAAAWLEVERVRLGEFQIRLISKTETVLESV